MDSMCRFGKYRVEREVLDEQRLEEITKRKPCSDAQPSLTEWLKDSLRCTVPKLKRSVVSSLPVLTWLPKYSVWEYGMPDLIAGISVGILHLPQSMAYALLASLPPVFGLYTSFYPVLIYFFFGTSRHISIGTFTVLSIMMGSVTERLAPDMDFLKMNGTNVTAEVNTAARDSYRVQVAAATTVLGGLIQVVLGLVKFGFVGTYLSEPLVRAYTTAAAVHAVVAQLKNIFGISPRRFSGPLSLLYTLKDVCSLLHHTHLSTLVVSAVSMVFLIMGKEFNSFLSPKLPIPIPVDLITIVTATLISKYAQLNNNYTVSVVGEIPSGLRSPSVPDVSLFGEVIGDAFAMAIVGYAICISLGKTFALKHGYKVDSNQELVALGLSNTVGGFFQCFSVCSSMSRSLVHETTGGKTQVAAVVSSLIVLVAILKLGPLFQELPKAVLGAIVFVNLKGMFKQYYDIVTLWRSSKIDLVRSMILYNFKITCMAEFVLVTFFAFVFHLGVNTVREIPGITIFRSSATLYFANAELYLEALKEKSGLDISKMLIYKRRLEAKQKRRERRAERRAKRQAKREVICRKSLRAAAQLSGPPVLSVEEEVSSWKGTCIDRNVPDQEGQDWSERENGTVFVIPTTLRKPDDNCRWEYLKSGDPDCTSLGWISELQDEDSTTLDSSSEDTLSHDLERVSLGSLGKWTWDIHSIILDLSTANFIDIVGLKTMKNIFHDFSEIDVDIYIAGCQATVVEQLELGGFFSQTITKRHLFASVHDAVLYCLDHRGATLTPRYEPSLVCMMFK
uniref:Solute carrier family 26 member 6, like 1 n=1 Tax=Mastacembelus armatus TaxID=205130 RepID=A0A7N8Y8M1_9TELE